MWFYRKISTATPICEQHGALITMYVRETQHYWNTYDVCRVSPAIAHLPCRQSQTWPQARRTRVAVTVIDFWWWRSCHCADQATWMWFSKFLCWIKPPMRIGASRTCRYSERASWRPDKHNHVSVTHHHSALQTQSCPENVISSVSSSRWIYIQPERD